MKLNLKIRSLITMFLSIALFSGLVGTSTFSSVLATLSFIPDMECFGVCVESEGEQGPQGPQGPAGTDGRDGRDGRDGAQGPAGETGAQGPAGLKGDTGAQGLPGLKGDTGAQGLRGDIGPRGPTGPQGQPGNDCPNRSPLHTQELIPAPVFPDNGAGVVCTP